MLLAACVVIAAILSNRLTARIRVPAPALVLTAAAIAVEVMPGVHAPLESSIEHIVTIALVCVLFDGGMHIGWPRFRSALAPIAVVGVLGTFLTAAGAAALCWRASLARTTRSALP